MTDSVLVGYATRYNSTVEVAEAIAGTLRDSGLPVDCLPLKDIKSLDEYSAVVMGAPLIMFRWHKDAHRFLRRCRENLEVMPVVVFALGPVHDPLDPEEWQNSWEQLNKALAQHDWFKPVTIKMFGGKYDPDKLGFPISMFAGDEPPSDIRDWEDIQDWTESLVPIL